MGVCECYIPADGVFANILSFQYNFKKSRLMRNHYLPCSSMLSGGASSSILIWDLESAKPEKTLVYRPKGRLNIEQAAGARGYGITHVCFYPFDTGAFLSSSYDHHLRIYATEAMAISASFDLGSIVYSHSISPIADHLLVACATQHPAVRLVDLRANSSAHSIAGHKGAVLSVAWSPLDEYLLASAGADGTVRLWDVRRSVGCIRMLDLEDSIGIGGKDGYGSHARRRDRGQAHVGAVNGVTWTEDARYLVTAGHDERVRVWDLVSGANTLSHFGPVIKNSHLSTHLPLLASTGSRCHVQRIMAYPNEKEIMVFDLLEGTLLKRLRIAGSTVAQANKAGSQRNVQNRISSLAWRSGNVEFYSAHTDGVIRAWAPWTRMDPELDKEDNLSSNEMEEDEGRKRKRQALDDVFKDLTRRKITFT